MINYERYLREVLGKHIDAGEIRAMGESTDYFSRLSLAFKVTGSKIDWSSLPTSLERQLVSSVPLEGQLVDFFREVRSEVVLNGDVVYIGDSAVDSAWEGPLRIFEKNLPSLLEIPQHHYLVSSEFEWCFCFSMEGEMSFGCTVPS